MIGSEWRRYLFVSNSRNIPIYGNKNGFSYENELLKKSAIHAEKLAIQYKIKHILDNICAVCAIVILSPLFLFICFLIKLEDSGPIFFAQERWGIYCRRIRIYKFRSMRVEQCDPTGVAQTVVNDPRLTRVGRILRRYNLDELPQLLNVVKGDMSFVGPRCHAVGMLAAGRLYEELVPNYHLRHQVRPGITGLAQIRGLRGPTNDVTTSRLRIHADLHYISNFSLWLDLKILFKTLALVTSLRGV